MTKQKGYISFVFIVCFTGGDIPDIGFRAGINGAHFNIKLTDPMQQQFDEIETIWNRKL